MNKIVFIGWGNVAQHFAKQFQILGFETTQILTRKTKTPFASIQQISELDHAADVYFIAVPDDQLIHVANSLPTLQGLVLHCCGSKGKEILSKQPRHGVLYPLQTFRKESSVELLGVPFFLECNNDFDINTMKEWVQKWGGNSYELSTDQKQKIHLAAVWAMNFSNAMYVISEKILQEIEIPFDIFKPLLHQALKNAMELGPIHSQTGPAIRKDENIMEQQSQQMTEELEKKLYLAISKIIQENA